MRSLFRSCHYIGAYSFFGQHIPTLPYKSDLPNGVHVIIEQAMDKAAKPVSFTAIPFCTFGNRGTYLYKVWVAETGE